MEEMKFFFYGWLFVCVNYVISSFVILRLALLDHVFVAVRCVLFLLRILLHVSRIR